MFSAMRGPHSLVPGLPSDLVETLADEVELSHLDRALIRALQLDGRRSFAAIGRDLDVPEKTVRRRVNELLERRVIHITTVSDPSLLGYTVSAMVGIQADGRRGVRNLFESIAELPCVDYAVITTGRYDGLVEVLCRDQGELLRIIDEDLVGRPGVARVEVFPYLRLFYQEPAWEVAQNKHRTGDGAATTHLDGTDRRIMSVLSEDGRRPFALVGEHLGISESQVRKRVGRLLETRTIRITAIANPRSLGFEMLAWVAIKCGVGHRVVEVAESLTRIGSVTYVAVTAGRFDIFAEIVAPNMEAVMQVMDGEIRTLPGVDGTEMLTCLDLYYRAVQPLGS